MADNGSEALLTARSRRQVRQPIRVSSFKFSHICLGCILIFLIFAVVYIYDEDLILRSQFQNLMATTRKLINDAQKQLIKTQESSFGLPTISPLMAYKINPKTIEFFRNQAIKRKEIFHANLFSEFYNVIGPEAICENLVRVGRLGDGGKWICNPWKIKDWTHGCVIYSLGLDNRIDFDFQLQNITGKKCELIGVDVKTQLESIVNQYRSIGGKIFITNLAESSGLGQTSFNDLVARFGHKKIDILKMDIESAEYQLMDQIFKFPICQMMVEVHGSRKQFYNFLHAASLAGFYLVHYEINAGNMNACELTLVHENCFDDFDVSIKLGKFLD